MAKPKPEPRTVEKYGLYWPASTHPVNAELQVIAHGGRWTKKTGGIAGLGNFYHFKEAVRLIWGDAVVQHRWFLFFLEQWLAHKYVGVLGSKNSGKSFSASIFHLVDYYAFSRETTIIVCSTTKEALEDRIWGEIKKYHRLAQENVPWLPGHLIEGRMRLITDDRDDVEQGRDFRNGFVGVPVMKGQAAVGLSAFVGRKNKRVRLLGDEIQYLPPAFLDSTANLDSAGGRVDFKLTGMGNPSEITKSLGLLCEPAAHLGGWEGGIDQKPITKCWPTRYAGGVAVQLPGRDCPNMDSPLGEPPPYPFLITRQDIDEGSQKYGIDDWKFRMFFDGIFPRGEGSRRVITRQLCARGGAMLPPVWRDHRRTQILSLDSAFRAVGGDRCILTRAEFGYEVAVGATPGELLVSNLLTTQDAPPIGGRVIFALIEQKVVPISAAEAKGAALEIAEAEDQIVKFTMAEAKQYGIPPENFFFDAGMKASLVAAYARLWSPKVTPVDFDGKPTERKVSREIDVSCRDYYFNFVTEMWYQVRMCIDAGQFRGMTESVMMEGCKREFEKVMGNKIQVEPKKEMKLKTGESPDQFDSLVIAFEGARRLGFTIAKFEPVDGEEPDEKWKQDLTDRSKKLWQSGALNHAA